MIDRFYEKERKLNKSLNALIKEMQEGLLEWEEIDINALEELSNALEGYVDIRYARLEGSTVLH
jgi:hypothetical protein